jgi:hypothetical protein
MTVGTLQYVGFATANTCREYTLRLKPPGGEAHDFVVAIASAAFVDHRARYQDGPEICFLKLQKELVACGETLPSSYLAVTDADLEAYRLEHAPRPPRRRPRPTTPTQ